MKRRDKEMTPAEEHIFRTVFQLTEKERCSVKINKTRGIYGKRHQTRTNYH